MDRKCFICNSKIKSSYQLWEIPNIPKTQKIGFGFCQKCNLVIQTSTIKPKKMFAYYETTATYINPGREGKPSQNKIDDVKRQLDFLQNIVNINKIKSAFQIGCSDGYTLSRIKELKIGTISGIDPSEYSHNIAKKFYKINTEVGVFEKYKTKKVYDLIIMTHVLEHLYNPNKILKKCNKILSENGYLLFEVPLFEDYLKFPIGMFTLEHLNYFSEFSLRKLFALSNFEILAIEKLYFNNNYPVITIILQKQKKVTQIEKSPKLAFNKYLKLENKMWKKIENKIKEQLKKDTKVYIWGAGLHTTQLLANTEIKKHLKIQGIVDSSITKHGKKIGKYTISKPSNALLKNSIVVVSSYASEDEIARKIQSSYKVKKTFTLYEKETK
jgi:SAM-dependent methyltransferase